MTALINPQQIPLAMTLNTTLISHAPLEGVMIRDLIENSGLTCHFQPIVNIDQGKILGYEALCRTIGANPFDSIEELFHQAMLSDLTFELDMLCRQNGMALAAARGLPEKSALLFLNICPNSLLNPEHHVGTTALLANRYGFSRQNIVLEITEHEAVANYETFTKAISHYRSKGFKVAIDDFGAGFGGLKMLSLIEPDFVKIDRHFFQDGPKNSINYNLIDSIATACHRIGIEVIGEGVERPQDLRICLDLGINLAQGYLLARPAPELAVEADIHTPADFQPQPSATNHFDEVICVGDIAVHIEPLSDSDRTLDALSRFNQDPNLFCLPVLRKGLLCGLLNRHRFMENHMVGRFGYGHSLNYYKKIADNLEEDFLQVPHHLSVEDVSRKIPLRRQAQVYDDICVTRSGSYSGVVSVSNILNAVTENSMMQARGANPLTGLPGNDYIQRKIAKMLSQSIHFDVCYIDLDSFKPYNDRHGFAMGDQVIKKVAELMVAALHKWEASPIGFAGHIGGDDFILITRPKNSIAICEYLIAAFADCLPFFHSAEECRLNSYRSVDRHGKEQQFGLLSLSIGIVSTEIHPISSFAEVSSIASDLKKRAKEMAGSVIVRDRRR